jgi:GTP-binding protein
MAQEHTEIRSAAFVRGVIGTTPILYDGVPQVAFVGRSNVGKSSVINMLTGRKNLVKVGKTPGKTTELNFFSINDGACYFVDLPGYGYARVDPKRKEKIKKMILWYLLYAEVTPRLVALIVDAKAGVTAFDTEMLRVLREQGHPHLVVANKIDKLNQKERAAALKAIRAAAGESPVVPCSATSGEGRAALLAAIAV